MVKLQEILTKLHGKDYLLFSDFPKPMSIAQIAAYLDCAYSSASQKVMVWHAKCWLKKIKTINNKVLYALNVEKEEDIEDQK